MGEPYILRKGVSTLHDLVGGSSAQGLGVGNVYVVIKSTEAFYDELATRFDHTYGDGSVAVHNDIQSALDVTVECRNDYVVVWPSDSDYDITAALTLSKKSVHLICPAGMGYDRGATNAVRIHQTTSATSIFTVSDAAVEIAGFYLKPYIGRTFIDLSAGAYAPNIHHNTFPLQTTTTNYAAILGAGDGCAWGGIERNWFISQGGDDETAASVIIIQSSATGARVNYNDFMIGDGNTVTAVVNNGATKGSVNYNTFAVAQGDGTMTHCIQVGTWGTAIGNRGLVADGALVAGGAVDVSFSDNMNAANGGVIDDAD